MTSSSESKKKLPLAGKLVLITRPEGRADEMAKRLAEHGAETAHVPTSRLESVDPAPFLAAIEHIAEYSLIVFTSATAVRFCSRILADSGTDISVFSRSTIAAIGPATAQALVREHLTPGIVAADAIGEGLIEAIRESGFSLKRSRILFPRAEDARDIVKAKLEEDGASVDDIVIYKSSHTDRDRTQQSLQALDRVPDVITFTSPSTVYGFQHSATGDIMDALRRGDTVIACIGPITAGAAEKAGLLPSIVSPVHTSDGLVDSLVQFFVQSS